MQLIYFYCRKKSTFRGQSALWHRRSPVTAPDFFSTGKLDEPIYFDFFGRTGQGAYQTKSRGRKQQAEVVLDIFYRGVTIFPRVHYCERHSTRRTAAFSPISGHAISNSFSARRDRGLFRPLVEPSRRIKYTEVGPMATRTSPFRSCFHFLLLKAPLPPLLCRDQDSIYCRPSSNGNSNGNRRSLSRRTCQRAC